MMYNNDLRVSTYALRRVDERYLSMHHADLPHPPLTVMLCLPSKTWNRERGLSRLCFEDGWLLLPDGVDAQKEDMSRLVVCAVAAVLALLVVAVAATDEAKQRCWACHVVSRQVEHDAVKELVDAAGASKLLEGVCDRIRPNYAGMFKDPVAGAPGRAVLERCEVTVGELNAELTALATRQFGVTANTACKKHC